MCIHSDNHRDDVLRGSSCEKVLAVFSSLGFAEIWIFGLLSNALSNPDSFNDSLFLLSYPESVSDFARIRTNIHSLVSINEATGKVDSAK